MIAERRSETKISQTNPSDGDRNGHLRYLLTAFVFDNISDDGRREVEEHVEACADCRAELRELQETVGVLEDALGIKSEDEDEDEEEDEADSQTIYSFEAKRVERVLDASKKRPWRRKWWILGSSVAAGLTLGMLGLSWWVSVSFETMGADTGQELSNADVFFSTEDAHREVAENGRLDVEEEAVEFAQSVAKDAQRTLGNGEGQSRTGIVRKKTSRAFFKRELAQKDFIAEDLGEAEPSARPEEARPPVVATRAPSKTETKSKSNAEFLERSLKSVEQAGGEIIGDFAMTGEVSEELLAQAKSPVVAGRLSDESILKLKRRIDTYGDGPPPVRNQIQGADARPRRLAGMNSETSRKRERLKIDKLGLAPQSETEPGPESPGGGAGGIDGPVRVEDGGRGRALKRGARRAELDGLLIQNVNGVLDFKEVKKALSETQLEEAQAEIPPKFTYFGDGAVALDELEGIRNAPFNLSAVRVDDGDEGDKAQIFELGDALQDNRLGLYRGKKLGDRIEVDSKAADKSVQFIRVQDFAFLADEPALYAYHYYQTLDPNLSREQFRARPMVVPPPVVGDEGLGREGFRERYGVNPFVATRVDPYSTFGLDVDTASYAIARSHLRAGRLPPKETVRVEEFVNSFREEVFVDPDNVFGVFCEGGPSPFGNDIDLLKITVKSRQLRPKERKDAVLTFAVDTSGSMAVSRRLGLVRAALQTLVNSLAPGDRVAIVAFGANAYVVLPHTSVREKERILAAIDSLAPTGGTNVEAGLDLTYRLADEALEPRAVNRVVLCTDGIANVGARGPEGILRKVKVFANRGIYLSAVGFGRGDGRYKDAMLQKLADEANGNYAFVDSVAGAATIFQQDLQSTLQVLAKDAKIQVHFDPQVVSHYRLIGYEKRDVADKDFRNDKIDAGEVGPGTTVTVLYEVVRRPTAAASLGRIYLRYLDTGTRRVDDVNFDVPPGVLASRLDETSDRFRFVAGVAELAELLRASYYARDGSFGAVLQLLQTVSTEYRARPDWREVAELTQRAQLLTVTQLSREEEK